MRMSTGVACASPAPRLRYPRAFMQVHKMHISAQMSLSLRFDKFFFQFTEEEEDYWNDDWYDKSYQEDDQELMEITKRLSDTEVN